MKETVKDWINLENLCKDRKRWKAVISKRRKFLREWEESMRKHTRGEEKPQRTQTRITKDLTCRWEGCRKKCRTKTGLVQHEQKIHNELTKKHKCPKCRAEFKEYTNLTNHVKACRGTVKGTCADCGRKVLPTNMARHRRENCPKQNQQQRERRNTNQIEGIEINRFTGKDERRSCLKDAGPGSQRKTWLDIEITTVLAGGNQGPWRA